MNCFAFPWLRSRERFFFARSREVFKQVKKETANSHEFSRMRFAQMQRITRRQKKNSVPLCLREDYLKSFASLRLCARFLKLVLRTILLRSQNVSRRKFLSVRTNFTLKATGERSVEPCRFPVFFRLHFFSKFQFDFRGNAAHDSRSLFNHTKQSLL